MSLAGAAGSGGSSSSAAAVAAATASPFTFVADDEPEDAPVAVPSTVYPLILLALDEQQLAQFGIHSVEKPVLDRGSVHRLCTSFNSECVRGAHAHSSASSHLIHFDKLDLWSASSDFSASSSSSSASAAAAVDPAESSADMKIPAHVNTIGLFGTTDEVMKALQQIGNVSVNGQETDQLIRSLS